MLVWLLLENFVYEHSCGVHLLFMIFFEILAV